jgi:hypothetical protein
MLGMMGGVDVLMPLTEPFVVKIKEIFLGIAKDDSLQDGIQTIIKKTADIDEVISKIEIIVQKRLDELTPQMVKEIMQNIIRKHLGWLVVWGGIFLGG